jgi:hypothetical protein
MFTYFVVIRIENVTESTKKNTQNYNNCNEIHIDSSGFGCFFNEFG